jgi:hypothetical protein
MRNTGPEDRKIVAPGERSEPGVGYMMIESPAGAKELYLTGFSFASLGLIDTFSLPGVRFAHPWLFSDRPSGA